MDEWDSRSSNAVRPARPVGLSQRDRSPRRGDAGAKAAISLAARGTMRTMTLQAVPIDDLVARLRDDPQ